MKYYILVCLLAASGVVNAPEVKPKTAPKPKPNLVVNGDFEKGKSTPVGWEKPDGKGVRWGKGLGKDGTRGVCIEMNQATAFGYGQGYFSAPIRIEPDTEYRITVDVKSTAPNAIIFVKGFSKVRDKYRETYSKHKEAHFDRYLKPRIASGEFVSQSFTFHPRHGTYPVRHVKVWLYGYLEPGRLWFDNVRIEKVGKAKPPKPEPPKKEPPRPVPDDADSSPPIYVMP